jgi:LmbE family N-acetylglucosaminyl deacetylase
VTRAASRAAVNEPSKALHVAPHPDDEALGAPATLLQLVDQGWRVVNVVVSLGHAGEQDRRRREAVCASERAGFEVQVLEPPSRTSESDDAARTQRELVETLQVMLHHGVDVVVGPSPHDGHPAHERAGRALRDAIEATGRATTWWMWGLWADLPFPSIYVPYGEAMRERVEQVLDAHAGEVGRNDYRRLASGRASANAVLGSERVFGYGSGQASTEPYAELLTEVGFDGNTWRLGAPRCFDPRAPFAGEPLEEISWWLHASSVHGIRRASPSQGERDQR